MDNKNNNINTLGSNEVIDNCILTPNINYGEILEVIKDFPLENYIYPIETTMFGQTIRHLCFDAEQHARDVAKKIRTDKEKPFNISKTPLNNINCRSLDVDFETFKNNPMVSVNDEHFQNYEEGLNNVRKSFERALAFKIKETNIGLTPYNHNTVLGGSHYNLLLEGDKVKGYPRDAIDLRYTYSKENTPKKINFNKVVLDNSQFSDKNIIRNNLAVSYDSSKIKYELNDIIYEYYSDEYEGEDSDRILSAFHDGGKNNIEENFIDFIENQNKGCINRNLSHLSLRFVYDSLVEMNLNHSASKNTEILGEYVKGFEKFENAIANMISNATDCPLGISYSNNETPDFIHLLRKNNIYDFLPYIGKIDNDFSFEENGKITIKNMGISYKMNSKVEASKTFDLNGESLETSFKYHLAIINKAANGTLNRNKNIKKNSVNTDLIDCLIKCVVFKFFLLGISKDNYDSVASLEKDINFIKNHSKNIEEIRDCVRLFYTELESYKEKIISKLNSIHEAIELSIFKSIGTGKRNPKEYKRDFLIFKSFLPENPMEELLKRTSSVSRNKKMIDTAMVSEGVFVEGVLYRIQFTFKIETLSYKETGENISGAFEFCEDKYLNLNIAYVPSDYLRSNKKKRLRYLNIPGNTTFYITYSTNDAFYVKGVNAFLYETIYRITCSIAVEVLAFLAQYKITRRNLSYNNIEEHKRLSILQIRPQEFAGTKNIHSNGFIRRFNKEVDFSIGKKYEINSQGFDFEGNQYIFMRHDSAIYSLYSKKEKLFKISQNLGVKKYAIISVTSTLTEGARSLSGERLRDYSNVTVLGNISKIDVTNSNVRIKTGDNFSYKSELKNIYNRSYDLRDKINQLVSEGYKEIIYIASAPNTQKFSLKRESGMDLYFFNESILEELLTENTIEYNIYPLYMTEDRGCDYRYNRKPFITTSDNDCDKGIVSLFSLYSGVTIGKGNYTSIINYYGLKNIYNNPIINSKVNRCFLEDVKDKLSKIMYLYHVSKQEKITKNDIPPKVNPYENLVGVEGIGKISKTSYHVEENAGGKKIEGTLYFNGLILTSNIIDKMFKAREMGNENR